MNNKPELLAPAGSIEALKSAVYCGADAVYLGLGLHNARIKSDEFNAENILQWVEFSHLYGVKVYITLNTLLKDSELKEVEELVKICALAKVDAFIIADLALIDICAKYAPNVPLHASTQLGIHNAYGAKIAQELGFKRVILARESLVSDIIEIKKATNLEVEYFVQGALCVAFSGNCLMSSMISGLSGNRGRCLQPCRQSYRRSSDNAEGYFLSTSDQCLINELDKLCDAGVDSLKIEGRLKRAEYVAETVIQYRAAIEGRAFDKEKLLAVYNRGGFSRGYNFDTTSQIMSVAIQGHLGMRAGEIINCKKLNNCFEITIAPIKGFEIDSKDGYKIISKEGEEIAGRSAEGIKKAGNNYLLYNNKPYPIGSYFHITTDSSRIDELSKISRSLPIGFKIKAMIGKEVEVRVSLGDIVCVVSGNAPEAAQNRPLGVEDFKKQFSKLSDTPFRAENIEVETDSVFMPISAINDLRRKSVEELRKAIIENYNKRQIANEAKNTFKFNQPFDMDCRMLVAYNRSEQISASIAKNSILIISPDEYDAKKVDILMNNALKYNSSAKFVLNLPLIARAKDMELIENIVANFKDKLCGVVINNLYGFTVCEKYNLKGYGGLGLNIMNKKTADILGLKKYVASVELSKSELKDLPNAAIYAFGNVCCMTVTHCPFSLAKNSGCKSCAYKSGLKYDDGKGTFAIRKIKLNHCYFEVRNGFCHNIVGDVARFARTAYIDLIDNFDGTEAVEAYLNQTPFNVSKQTGGHFNRGVK